MASLVLSSSNGAISEDQVKPLLVEAEAAAARWKREAPPKYSYRLKLGGPFTYTIYKIRVDGTTCTAKSRFFTAPRSEWRSESCERLTVGALFAEIRRQLALPQERIELSYAGKFGLPAAGSFDPYSDTKDDSSYFVLEGFVAR